MFTAQGRHRDGFSIPFNSPSQQGANDLASNVLVDKYQHDALPSSLPKALTPNGKIPTLNHLCSRP